MKNKTIKFFCIMTIFLFAISVLPITNIVGATTVNYIENIEDSSYILGNYLTGLHGLITGCNNSLLKWGNISSNFGCYNDLRSLRYGLYNKDIKGYWNFTDNLISTRFESAPTGAGASFSQNVMLVSFVNITGVTIGTMILKSINTYSILFIDNPTYTNSTSPAGQLPYYTGFGANRYVQIAPISQNVINVSVRWEGILYGWKHIATTGNAYEIRQIVYTQPYSFKWHTDLYFDDFDITLDDGYSIPNYGSVYFNFYDTSFDNPMIGYNTNQYGPFALGTKLFSINSDLWTGDYNGNLNIVGSPDIINSTFTDGSYHWLNVSCYEVGGKIYTNYSYKFQWFHGNTYNVVLYPNTFTLWENEQTITENGLEFGVRTDKFSYQYQEQIRIQYKLPTVQQLTDKGYSINSFHIKGYNQSFFPDIIYLTKNTPFNCNIFSNTWVDAPSFLAVKPPTGLTRMTFMLYRNWWWFIDATRVSVQVSIYDYVTSFKPHGNITSVLPLNPVVGEETTINFNANNNGYIQIENLGTHSLVYNQSFLKPVGNAYVYYTFSGIGAYLIHLKVWNGVSLHENDTYYLWVNSSGSEYEDWGYNTEYLTVEENRLIAGYDFLTVYYKSKINNTEIRVKSPSGSYMPFGTTVSNITSGTYKVKLPEWLQIGEYNITMNTTHGILWEIFHIVADENNYAEFEINSYAINSSVSFYIRHNVRCKVIILKDGVPYGQDYFFDNNTVSEGYFPLADTSFFTTGVWTLELWETNNQIPRKLMSSDTALFYETKTSIDKIDTSILNSISFIFDAPLCYFIGVIIIVLLTISPLLLGLLIGGNLDLSSIPQFLYLVLAIVGFVLDILLGFFPPWSIFVLIMICVMIALILYLKGKGQ